MGISSMLESMFLIYSSIDINATASIHSQLLLPPMIIRSKILNLVAKDNGMYEISLSNSDDGSSNGAVLIPRFVHGCFTQVQTLTE